MEITRDPIAEITKREALISAFIKQDNDSVVHYEYSVKKDHNGTCSIDVSIVSIHTYNPKHDTSFLLFEDTRSFDGSLINTKLVQLDDALKYLKGVTKSNKMNTYTIKWAKQNDSKTNTSYFWGTSMLDVIKKFFSGKNEYDYVIYEIMLSPES